MNPTPTSDGPSHEASPRHTQTLASASAEAVPRQQPRSPEAGEPRGATITDLLEHPDPHTAAQAAAVENLLRCWVRETNLPAPTNGTLHIPLTASGTALLAQVHYWSPTGWHRFGLPYLSNAPHGAPPPDAVTVAALLAREAGWAAVLSGLLTYRQFPAHRRSLMRRRQRQRQRRRQQNSQRHPKP